MKKPFVIAEVGCNHKGDFEIAKEFIQVAKYFCKVDAVKFQKRNPRELLTEEQYNAPHPVPHNAYSNSYGGHREFLEFSVDKHGILKELCEELGLVYLSSVWDMTSAKEIISLNPEIIKIPSACNNHFAMMDYICDNFSGQIHVSLGMTTKAEIDELVQFFTERKKNRDVTLYSCTSGYPVPFKDVCLHEITYLRDKYERVVQNIGFSGHHNGIAVDMAAYTLGATVVERHFTLNRTWKGTDHAASLEPDGMRKLARDLNNVYLALCAKEVDILPIEAVQREKLKYRPKE